MPRPKPDTLDPSQGRQSIGRLMRRVFGRGPPRGCGPAAGVDSDPSGRTPGSAERCRLLRDLESAARRARAVGSSGAGIDESETAFAESRRFLSEALPGYEVLNRIHYGGQGIVYKAFQTATRRNVAIKVLLDGPLASERQRSRFEREVELISRLQHPNIVTLYESGVVRGRHYFTMEFIEGLPIDDYVLVEDLAVRDVVGLFVTVCRTVSYAHQRGVIHRDLNPANVIVDLDGTPQILDFGLAKDVWAADGEHAPATITVTGQCVGTLPYLSPEQAGGFDGQVDVRSDVYALGVMLFRLLTSVFPYPVAGEPAFVQRSIIETEPLRLRCAIALAGSDARRGVQAADDDLEMILVKALAKEKERRYQSAAELAADLERYLAGDAVAARADSRFYLLRRALRRHRALAAAAALFLVLVGVFSTAVTLLWFQARMQRESAREVARVAHAALNDVVTEIDEAVQPLAGGAEVRNRLLDGVADHLARLRPLVDSDAALEDVGAALREKQGDLAFAHGRHSEAAGHYAVFLAAAERRAAEGPGCIERRCDVLRAHQKLARVSEQPAAHFERAVALGEAIVREHPDDLDAQHALSKTLVEYGRHLFDGGQHEAAEVRLVAARAIATRFAEVGGDSDRWDMLLADVHEWIGETQRALGRGDGGIDAFRMSLSLRRRLSDASPADAQRRCQLLVAWFRLATALRVNGQIEEAKQALVEAVAIGEYLTAVDPAVMAWKYELYRAYDRLARLLLDEREIEQARVYCHAAVALAEEAVEKDPESVVGRDILAFSHIMRGRLSLTAEDAADAYREFEAATGLWSELSAADPENVGWRDDLAAAHNFAAWSLRLLGRTHDALQRYQRAYEIRLALFNQQPDVNERALGLIMSKMKLAAGYIAMKTEEDDQRAAAFLADARQSLEALHAAGRLAGQGGTYAIWMDTIRTNDELLERRAAARAAPTASGATATMGDDPGGQP